MRSDPLSEFFLSEIQPLARTAYPLSELCGGDRVSASGDHFTTRCTLRWVLIDRVQLELDCTPEEQGVRVAEGPDNPRCERCGRGAEQTDQFCVQCGAALQTSSSTPRSNNSKRPAQRAMKWIVLTLLIALVAVVAVKITNSDDSNAPTHTITGERYYARPFRGECGIAADPSRPRPGVGKPVSEISINIYDGDGTVIATGRYDEGVPTAGYDFYCTYTFAITGVPEVPIYQFNTSLHSGKSTNSFEQLKAQNWVWQFD